MNKLILATVVSLCSLLGPLSLTAKAQVVINGVLFQGQELYQLEQQLGYPISPGRYWYDPNTGNWGYEGNPIIQGNVYRPNQVPADSQNYYVPPRRPGLSERGLLYYPGEILSH